MLSGLATLLLFAGSAEPACATLPECQRAVVRYQVDGHAFTRAAEALGADPAQAALDAVAAQADDLMGHPLAGEPQAWPEPVVRAFISVLDDPHASVSEALAALALVRRVRDHDALVQPVLRRQAASREPMVALSALHGLAAHGDGEAALILLRRCGDEPDYPYQGWRRPHHACVSAYDRALDLDLAAPAFETVRATLPGLQPEEQNWLLRRIATERRSEAAPLFVDALDAAHWRRNWRLGFEAAAGLTGLDAPDKAAAEAALEAAARDHWMPAVRAQAALALHGLQTGSLEGSGQAWAEAQLAERAQRLGDNRNDHRMLDLFERSAPRLFFLDFDESPLVYRSPDRLDPDRTIVPGCQAWRWDGLDFEGVDTDIRADYGGIVTLAPHEFTFLAGSDFGQWSGALTATGFGSRSRVLSTHINVIGMARSPRGVWVLSGRDGYVIRGGALDHVETPIFDAPSELTRIATLSAKPITLREIAPGRVAIFGSGWVMVADQDGVEGLATCTDAP